MSRNIALESLSGGTDLCTPFVGGSRILPVYAGEMQYRYLSAKVEAFDEGGGRALDQVGELVITEPMPSMPGKSRSESRAHRLADSISLSTNEQRINELDGALYGSLWAWLSTN